MFLHGMLLHGSAGQPANVLTELVLDNLASGGLAIIHFLHGKLS